MAAFETFARKLHFDPANTDLSSRLHERQMAAEVRNNDLVRTSQSQQQALQALRTKLATARSREQNRHAELAAKKQTLDEVMAQLNGLRTDGARMQVSLEADRQQIVTREAATLREIEDIAAQIAAKRTELFARQEVRATQDLRAQIIENQLAMHDNAIRSLHRAIESHERDLEALGLSRQTEHTQLSAKAEEQAHRVSVFDEIKQSVIALEMGIDAAATAAASAQLVARIRAADNEFRNLREKRVHDELWTAYFESLQEKLEQTQDRAVANYTREFGPLTSIIQRRLRLVSGFEEITLHPDGGNIDVRVTRHGERLPPSDFFSQSQQQVLILSLFLTACTTQTWSAFAPILLDEPVTHFDDLNAYSFLDLVAGLLENSLHGRQFILSTCDERLFQLVRQRFHHLSDRTKLYRFTSLGSDGPVIESV